MVSNEDRSEIVFFDLETTIPTGDNDKYAILEFGSILVCPNKLIELETYDTLVRPLDLSLITPRSIRANGITADHVVSSPTFLEIADKVYHILHGRVWAGHNILEFDCERLKDAYAEINRQPPVPKGTIDTLLILRQRFGTRAGNMKMGILAAYFRLGKQRHRSLDDVQMNLEVVKCCASVLFLESCQQDTFTEKNPASLNVTPFNPCNGKSTLEGTNLNICTNSLDSSNAPPDKFHTSPFVDKPAAEALQSNEATVKEPSKAFSENIEFIEPDTVSMAAITVTFAPFLQESHRIKILHKDIPLQIRCDTMRIHSGLSTQFADHAGKPRLSLAVDANSSNLCKILDVCDNIAKRFMDPVNNSEWMPIVSRNPSSYNSATITLHVPIEGRDTTSWITEIEYKKSSSSSASTLPLVSSWYDMTELKKLFHPDSFVDAYFSLDPYNYQQNAGIRLVAKKLIIHTN